MEFRYKLSDPGVSNGTIEAWINGTKVYSDSDLEACGNYSGQGHCDAIAEISQFFWYNYFVEGESSTGYGLFDNFIISRSYIGPPYLLRSSPA